MSTTTPAAPPAEAGFADVPPLRFVEVTQRFGGLTALDEVSFDVRPGTIHALIGPNGAGKSSCFNVISGLYRPAAGSVHFGDVEISRLRPHRIAGAGIGRAFQNVALSGDVTVLDNVMLGRHSLTRGGFLGAGLRLPGIRREQARHVDRVVQICAFLGLDDHLDRAVSELSYGDQKRVDVARALATEPRLLMLDEPAAGMNDAETERLGVMIREIRDALQISVLLVEHDMGLVMTIADHVTVLDFGHRIADGPPAEVREDPDVIRAYLGSDSAVDQPLGGPADLDQESL